MSTPVTKEHVHAGLCESQMAITEMCVIIKWDKIPCIFFQIPFFITDVIVHAYQ